MKTFAWAFERAMEDGTQFSRTRPDRNNCITDPERLYHERDIKRLIDAVKVLIDKTTGICEFSYGDEMEAAYSHVRHLIGYRDEEYDIMRASNEIRKDIDADVIQNLKGKP